MQTPNHIENKSEHGSRSIMLFTSSRDKLVKMWRLQWEQNPIKSCNITLEQTIEGHVHSVWDVDCTMHFLVAGSADKTIRVWRNTMYQENDFSLGKTY